MLASYALFTLGSGLKASHGHITADLITREREYAVFRQGIYPLGRLVNHPVPEGFPNSVYPPYAQLMFAVFFAWGGSAQGWAMVHGLSLLSLGLIACIGWCSLCFAGPAAAVLGALSPIAIGGNSNCLYHGQFSIICMGLVSLQWLLLKRQRPLPAGLCWALAMLKPQIAAAFALPLLKQGNRRGLLLGMAILLSLSAASLAFTKVSPIRYASLWLEPGMLSFVGAGNMNLMGLLRPWVGGILALLALLGGGRMVARSLTDRVHHQHPSAGEGDLGTSLRLQGLCAVLGALATYHFNYDNIMLFPALLAILALALRHPGIWYRVLAMAMALSLWFPVHLTADRVVQQTLIAGVWLVVGLTLLVNGPERFGPKSDFSTPKS